MKTNDHKTQQWDSWQADLDRALKNLPEKTAPSNLLPNVMAEIRKREVGKGFRHSFHFGYSWLRASVAVFALSLITYLSFIGGRVYDNHIAPAVNLAGGTFRTLLGSLADLLSEIPFAAGDEVLRFLIPGLIFVMLAMYLACIGVGTFIYRTVRR